MKHLAVILGLLLSGCDSDDGNDDDDSTQVPPRGADAVEAWLADGAYLDWSCEPEPHAARSPSPHGVNRICSNDVLSAHEAGEYPVDAASVKELYADDSVTIVGYAVALHVRAGTEGGDWYWYERVPLDHPAPHDANGVVADALGDSGPAQSICVSCHSAAGSDAAHSGHDFVYTQVR
jgi:hypothetical protein